MSPGEFLIGPIRWYAALIVTGMALAVWLATLEERRRGLPKDTILDLALWLLPIGVLGARIYYVIFSWDRYAADPLSALYIWEGGLAIYGGVIAGALTALVFAKKRGLPLRVLADMIAPGLALAQGIGRWGNFFNSEAYGVETAVPFWRFFPASVLIGDTWHLACFFYESVLDIAVFVWLWCRRKKRLRDGDTTLGYLLLYGAGRMLIEGLRTDSLYLTGTLRISQLLSAAMVLAVCVVWMTRVKGPTRLWLLLPAALLAAATVCGVLGASLGVMSAVIAGYGAAAILCTAIFEIKAGGLSCPTAS